MLLLWGKNGGADALSADKTYRTALKGFKSDRVILAVFSAAEVPDSKNMQAVIAGNIKRIHIFFKVNTSPQQQCLKILTENVEKSAIFYY